MNLQGRDTPAHHPNPDAPRGGGGGKRPTHQKPAHPRPAPKPAHQKPTAHKPVHRRPSKPEPRGKKSAGREVELIWFDDTVFAPLAKGGHIH